MKCIYKITSPTGKIYIGQTTNFNKRCYQYSKIQCKKQCKLYASLVKHGFENHYFSILETGNLTKDDLNRLEKFYIDKYNSFNTKVGLNLTSGGDKPTFTPEAIKQRAARLKAINTGRKHTEEAKKKIAAAASRLHLGLRHTPEAKLKMSEGNKGRIIPDFVRDKISNSLKGRAKGLDSVQRTAEKLKGKYYPNKQVIDLLTGIYYQSVREAWLTTNQRNYNNFLINLNKNSRFNFC